MVGERMQELRKDRGLSQSELARALHINKHSISAYEREKNEPSDEIKIRMVSFFNVSVDYLLGITDDPTPGSKGLALPLPKDFPLEEMEKLKSYAAFLYMQHKSK